MLPAAVDPVTVSVSIGRPREEVFAYLSDIANHPEFSDHYLEQFRLTRVDSVGPGAGAASSFGPRSSASPGRT